MSKYSDAEMTKVMAEKERCPQLKYDKSKAPALKVRQFECARAQCKLNDEGQQCISSERWFTCRRQIEP